MSWAVWLTGRPACGKSAIARELLRLVRARGLEPEVLESDVLRTQLTPHAGYDEALAAYDKGLRIWDEDHQAKPRGAQLYAESGRLAGGSIPDDVPAA